MHSQTDKRPDLVMEKNEQIAKQHVDAVDVHGSYRNEGGNLIQPFDRSAAVSKERIQTDGSAEGSETKMHVAPLLPVSDNASGRKSLFRYEKSIEEKEQEEQKNRSKATAVLPVNIKVIVQNRPQQEVQEESAAFIQRENGRLQRIKRKQLYAVSVFQQQYDVFIFTVDENKEKQQDHQILQDLPVPGIVNDFNKREDKIQPDQFIHEPKVAGRNLGVGQVIAQKVVEDVLGSGGGECVTLRQIIGQQVNGFPCRGGDEQPENLFEMLFQIQRVVHKKSAVRHKEYRDTERKGKQQENIGRRRSACSHAVVAVYDKCYCQNLKIIDIG